MRRRASWFLAALLLDAAAGEDAPDAPFVCHFDLTKEGDKSPTVLALKLPARVWQHGDHPPGWAPGSSVRKGWGSAFFYVDDPSAPGTAAHGYLEIEPLGDRSLEAAVAASLGELGATCERAGHTLRTPPGKPKRYEKLKLGGKKVAAFRAAYTVSPPARYGDAVFRSEALFFALNGHLVTLAVDNAGANDFFGVFAGALALAAPADAGQQALFKLYFADGGVSRFLVLTVPAGFRRDYRSEEGAQHAASWERRDAEGAVQARFTVSESWAHKLPLAEVMEKQAEALRPRYEGFAGPEKTAVSKLDGYRIAYRVTDGDVVEDVCEVRARLQNQDYVLRWETVGGDAERAAADAREFDQIVKAAKVWRSRIP
ncbi:MAG: hypothetical protein ACHQ1G_00535 [Planctomycetota bacterium]